MSAVVKTFDKEFNLALKQASNEGIVFGARELRTLSRRKVNRKFNGKASKPGEPPKRRTGRGWRGIQVDSDKRSGVARVVIRKFARHMFLYEVGRGVEKRMWLIITLLENKARIISKMLGEGRKQINKRSRR